MDQSEIQHNITTRKLAEELVEMGLELAKETGLSPEHIRKFWELVIENVAVLINVELVPRAKLKIISPMTDEESRKFGRQIFPFGKHQSKPMDEVPMDYLEWYCDTAETQVREIKRYLESERIQHERR